MAWYHIKIDNLWTRPKPGFERDDRNHWQVGFSRRNGILLAGFYDHLIETETKLRNMSAQIQEYIWPDLVLALGHGYDFLHGQAGPVKLERQAILDAFGRFGRDPDDVADWMIFTNLDSVPNRWWALLESDTNGIGVNLEALARLLEHGTSIVLWALDGHIYGGFAGVDERAIRACIAPIEKQIGPAARHHELVF